MKILVTGGAGYIGSFMTKRLLDEHHEVIVLDSMERGEETVLDPRAQFVKGSIQDRAALDALFAKEPLDAVVHFAGYISMAESMQSPEIYFQNNTLASLTLLQAMQQHSVKKIIFSSTAGVYGNPERVPIAEEHPKNPTNPYGESKLMTERVLYWYSKIYGINAVVLRYFNACGAALDGSMGENHDPETHIIPNALHAVLENMPFQLYGTDYKTVDGTCVRDYIHVIDLVEAHVLALKKLEKDPGYFIYNVGTGKGYSNKEVLVMIEKVSGKKVPVAYNARRLGDADVLIAGVEKIQSELDFSPKHSDLETIISSAWKWHSRGK